jgi:hypothetical protein
MATEAGPQKIVHDSPPHPVGKTNPVTRKKVWRVLRMAVRNEPLPEHSFDSLHVVQGKGCKKKYLIKLDFKKLGNSALK